MTQCNTALPNLERPTSSHKPQRNCKNYRQFASRIMQPDIRRIVTTQLAQTAPSCPGRRTAIALLIPPSSIASLSTNITPESMYQALAYSSSVSVGSKHQARAVFKSYRREGWRPLSLRRRDPHGELHAHNLFLIHQRRKQGASAPFPFPEAPITSIERTYRVTNERRFRA